MKTTTGSADVLNAIVAELRAFVAGYPESSSDEHYVCVQRLLAALEEADRRELQAYDRGRRRQA